jgi:hypothetical protein
MGVRPGLRVGLNLKRTKEEPGSFLHADKRHALVCQRFFEFSVAIR